MGGDSLVWVVIFQLHKKIKVLNLRKHQCILRMMDDSLIPDRDIQIELFYWSIKLPAVNLFCKMKENLIS